MVENIRTN